MKTAIFLLGLLVCLGYVYGQPYCYYCANCPVPFTPSAPGVTIVTSNTGFCAKKSYSADPYAANSRGVADPGLCAYNGCRWTVDSAGRQLYVCCCNTNYCN